MGTNQFQREYIEYLQERNTELLSRLNHLKENYENKVLAKDLNKHYLISALEDVLNVCTAIPQEIDLFFDKMSAAMNTFKNILLRKSEMVQLVEKISKVINFTENSGSDLISVGGSGLMKEQISEASIGRKAGTVKVSPMINGHIISTEPRIYLSRVPGVFTPGRKSEAKHLSPIIEASPDTSSDPSNFGGHIIKEIKIPLERINLNKMSYNYITEESPKSRFKGPKTWKKSLSSNKRQSDHQKNTVFLENAENLNKKFSVGEVDIQQLPENIDPLEGPSWLYEEISEMNSSSSRFIDYRRRKHRFATVFDKVRNEDGVTYFKEKLKKSLEKNSDECCENGGTNYGGDFEEGKKSISESSEDFIGGSFSSECEDNNFAKRKKSRSSNRVSNKESNKNNNNNSNSNESVNDIKKEISIYSKNEKQTSTFNTPIYSDSSEGENNEEKSVWQSGKEKRHSLKSSPQKGSLELSFEKTPNKTTGKERETRISKKIKSSRRKNINDVIVKSENRMSAKEIVPKKSKRKSPSEKSKSKSKSRSPVIFFPENEGRKRRKAAPSFKLVEPKLKTKLRRS